MNREGAPKLLRTFHIKITPAMCIGMNASRAAIGILEKILSAAQRLNAQRLDSARRLPGRTLSRSPASSDCPIPWGMDHGMGQSFSGIREQGSSGDASANQNPCPDT